MTKKQHYKPSLTRQHYKPSLTRRAKPRKKLRNHLPPITNDSVYKQSPKLPKNRHPRSSHKSGLGNNNGWCRRFSLETSWVPSFQIAHMVAKKKKKRAIAVSFCGNQTQTSMLRRGQEWKKGEPKTDQKTGRVNSKFHSPLGSIEEGDWIILQLTNKGGRHWPLSLYDDRDYWR